MSQHTYQTEYQGKPTRIRLGFDRPLQGFFMDIDQQLPFETISIYASSRDEALHGSAGMAKSMDHFCEKLIELGLTVPESMLLAVQRDGELNAGNVVRDHGSSQAAKPKSVPPVKVGEVAGASVYAATYPNGRLAVYLSNGMSGRVTMNVPSIDLPADEVLVKMSGDISALRDQLLGLGVFTDTGTRYQVGFDELERWHVEAGRVESLLS